MAKETKPKAKAETQAEADAKLKAEAKMLGVPITRSSVAGARVKDKAAAQALHDQKAMSRLRKDVAKAKAKPLSPKEARKKLLLARLNNTQHQYTREQIRQFRAELHAIKTDQWFEPYLGGDGKMVAWKVPKKMTNYEKFMANG